MSRELDRDIAGSKLIKPELSISEYQAVTVPDNISVVDLQEYGGKTKVKRQVSDLFSIQSRSVEKIMDECKGNNLMIFTDSAVCGGSVGLGSCAAVLFPLTGAKEVQVKTRAVGSRVSSLDCEIEGMALGITMANGN